MIQQDFNKKKRTTHDVLYTSSSRTWLFSPLIISISIIVFDQISKFLVIVYIAPFRTGNDIVRVIDDFLWLIHVTNKGALFSFGSDFAGIVRLITLYILPILLLVFLTKIMLYSSWHRVLRLVSGGIVGGGAGNMIDRIFREEGVVDFISVKFYGLFGFERWPTFNFADTTIVICMIIWIAIIFFPSLFLRQRTHHEKVK